MAKKKKRLSPRAAAKARAKVAKKFPKGTTVKATVRGKVIAHGPNRVLIKRTGTRRLAGFDPKNVKRVK